MFIDTEDLPDGVIRRIVNKSRLAIQICLNTMDANCRFYNNYAVNCVTLMPYTAAAIIIVSWLLISLKIMKSS